KCVTSLTTLRASKISLTTLRASKISLTTLRASKISLATLRASKMKTLSIFIMALLVAGCVQMPKDSFFVTPELLKQRQIETRRYDGIKEDDLLAACSNVLQ